VAGGFPRKVEGRKPPDCRPAAVKTERRAFRRRLGEVLNEKAKGWVP
jgi:hypothetical protein